MKRLFCILILLSSLPGICLAVEPLKFIGEPSQDINVPFRLFRTDNMWSFLMLDTRDGRVWQISYGVDDNAFRGTLPINDMPLAINEPYVGRFTLYPTGNMWTFLLLDQKTGKVWQCQFSIKSEESRLILPLFNNPENTLIPAKSNRFNLTDLEGKPVTKPNKDPNLIDLGPAPIPPPPKGFVLDENIPPPPAGFTEVVTPKP